VRTHTADRIPAARRLAALGVLALAALVAATSPAAAAPGRQHAGKTVVLRYYSVVASFVYTRADGTVVEQPPQNAAVGDHFDVTELAYKGTHSKHAKKWSATSHTTCVFESVKGAPTCDGQSAVGGNQLLLFHTPAGSAPAVSGGTGRYAGATGTVAMTEIGDTNNSDVVVTVHLRT
jgi:hypothetical protein